MNMVECERVYSWRNLRVSHLEEIKNMLSDIQDDELFALKQLEIDDIYQALNPVFIEDKRSYMLSLKNNKGKGIEVAEEVNEDRFQSE